MLYKHMLSNINDNSIDDNTNDTHCNYTFILWVTIIQNLAYELLSYKCMLGRTYDGPELGHHCNRRCPGT